MFAGFILEAAYIAIRVFSRNTAIPETCADFVTDSHPAKFCSPIWMSANHPQRTCSLIEPRSWDSKILADFDCRHIANRPTTMSRLTAWRTEIR